MLTTIQANLCLMTGLRHPVRARFSAPWGLPPPTTVAVLPNAVLQTPRLRTVQRAAPMAPAATWAVCLIVTATPTTTSMGPPTPTETTLRSYLDSRSSATTPRAVTHGLRAHPTIPSRALVSRRTSKFAVSRELAFCEPGGVTRWFRFLRLLVFLFSISEDTPKHHPIIGRLFGFHHLGFHHGHAAA